MVDIKLSLKMVTLMLEDSREEALKHLFMRLQILIEPLHADMLHAGHILLKSGQTEASL